MRKYTLFLVFLAIGLGANAAQAAAIPAATQTAFADLATRAYGDRVCGPMLMSANLSWILNPGTPTGILPAKPIFPRNTSCILTQSYVNLPGANLVSQETLDTASPVLDSATTFAENTMMPLAEKNGEAVSLNRITHRMATPYMGMNYEQGLAQLALFVSEYGWDKGEPLMDVRVTLQASATSTWNARLAAVIASTPTVASTSTVVAANTTSTQTADHVIQSEDGTMWSFIYQGKLYVNGKQLTGSQPTGFILDPKHDHWAYITSSTVATDRGTYGPYADEAISEPWFLADGSVMYVVGTTNASTTVQTMYRDGKPIAVADAIGSVTYLPNISDVVYTVHTAAGWAVVSGSASSETWASIGSIVVDNMKGGVAYVATSNDGKLKIVFNGTAYSINWTPATLDFNDGNHLPYAVSASGQFWTPTHAWTYPEKPILRGTDSQGHMLALTPFLGEFVDMWSDDTYIGRFRNIDFEHAPPLSVKKEIDPYFPGYVMTYPYSIAFDSQNQLIIYRQEGRVFTRTTYKIK